MEKDDFIKEYRSLVDEIVYCRNRLKNPVHKKSGKPLAQSTITGFRDKIDYLKKQLKRYRVVLKLLVMCGYLGKKPDELKIEQEVIKAFLRDYIHQQWHIEYRKNRADQLEKVVEHWKFSSDAWENLYDHRERFDDISKETNSLISKLKKNLDGDRDDDEELAEKLFDDPDDPRRMRRLYKPHQSDPEKPPCKVYPFQVIDGGQKVEEQPRLSIHKLPR